MDPKTRGDASSRGTSETAPKKSRRGFLKQGAALVTGAASAGLAQKTSAQSLAGQPWERVYGAGFTGYGQPSRFEQPVMRHIGRPYGDLAPGSGATLAPIESLEGIITPSGLHNIRSHSGTPDIDPKEHQLLLHGLVQRPLKFSMEALWSYPMTSRIHFLECSGNSNRNLAPQPAQVPAGVLHGNIACSEWTGVPLRVLLEEAGLMPQAKWILAEGADSAHMSRSIPIEKALDDALIALYQNGERLRPQQGYPVRLLLPGWEGNMNVKWLRRLKLVEAPAMSYYEARTYAQILPGGKAWQFYFLQEVKSFITQPSPGLALKGPGFYEISGIAYSGNGRISKVMLSADGGASWAQAALQEPLLSKAFTRFRVPWNWNGAPAVLQSRAWDDQGNVQPTRAEIIAHRGVAARVPNVLGFPSQHFNGITSWAVDAKGEVRHVYA